MNILITGNAGLIGSRLANYFLDNTSYKVMGIDDLSGGLPENLRPEMRINTLTLDISKEENDSDIDKWFDRHNPDIVYHAAAYAAEGLSPFIRCYNYQNNLTATARIVNKCIKYGVKRLVFFSSLAVYGNGSGDSDRFYEEDRPHPLDPYGVAKYACEIDIRIAGEQHGLDWCIIRPHNVFGIGQNIFDRYRNVIGIWMLQKINKQPYTIYGDGEQSRAFTVIDNILPSLSFAGVEKIASQQVINLGGKTEYSLNSMLDILDEIIGKNDRVYLEDRHEVKHAIPSYQKSIDILNYREDVSIQEGLEKMWRWCKTLDKRDRFRWSNYEIDNGIYSYWK